jgi:hypothetical protein
METPANEHNSHKEKIHYRDSTADAKRRISESEDRLIKNTI